MKRKEKKNETLRLIGEADERKEKEKKREERRK